MRPEDTLICGIAILVIGAVLITLALESVLFDSEKTFERLKIDKELFDSELNTELKTDLIKKIKKTCLKDGITIPYGLDSMSLCNLKALENSLRI